MNKFIVTAAVTGGITTRDKNPNIPYTPKEIAQSVYDFWNAGAAITHIHARNPDGTPAYNADIWGEIVSEIRARCDILINLSKSGLNLPAGLPKNTAWNHLQFQPDIASFNCGSLNHGEKPFINPPSLARELGKDLKVAGVRAQVEVYNEGILSEAIRHAEDTQKRDFSINRIVFALRWASLVLSKRLPAIFCIWCKVCRKEQSGQHLRLGKTSFRSTFTRCCWVVTFGRVLRTTSTTERANSPKVMLSS